MRLRHLPALVLTLILCSTTSGFSQTSEQAPAVPTDLCKGEIRISLKKAVAINDSIYKLHRTIDSLAMSANEALDAQAHAVEAYHKEHIVARSWERSFDSQAQLRQQALAERDQARAANRPWKVATVLGILGTLAGFIL